MCPGTNSRVLMDTVLAMNSGPLSERMKAGSPLLPNSDVRVATTSSAVIERSISMLRQ
jgi:hypothetical protein